MTAWTIEMLITAVLSAFFGGNNRGDQVADRGIVGFDRQAGCIGDVHDNQLMLPLGEGCLVSDILRLHS